jgi:hypothetical protein
VKKLACDNFAGFLGFLLNARLSGLLLCQIERLLMLVMPDHQLSTAPHCRTVQLELPEI